MFFKKKRKSVLDFDEEDRIVWVLEKHQEWYCACLKRIAFMKGDMFLTPQVNLGYNLYFMGSIDHLARHCHLNHKAYRNTSSVILQSIGCHEIESLLLVDNWNYIIKTDFATESVNHGGVGVQKWLSGDAVTGPIELSVLVRRWSKIPKVPDELHYYRLLLNILNQKVQKDADEDND